MTSLLGAKELYDVTLKATYPIVIGDRIIEAGEVIVAFDNILISDFREKKDIVTASGGYSNRDRVLWDDTREVSLYFTQGVFSKEQFAVSNNAKMFHKKEILISKREKINLDENNEFSLKEEPIGKIFVYDKASGSKLDFERNENGSYKVISPLPEVIVDYTFNYKNGYDKIMIGEKLINGYLILEGKTRLKDDITGKETTGIIKIPKLRLTSELSMRLGREASPMVINFSAKAYPTGTKGEIKAIEFIFLEDDIDADI